MQYMMVTRKYNVRLFFFCCYNKNLIKSSLTLTLILVKFLSHTTTPSETVGDRVET